MSRYDIAINKKDKLAPLKEALKSLVPPKKSELQRGGEDSSEFIKMVSSLRHGDPVYVAGDTGVQPAQGITGTQPRSTGNGIDITASQGRGIDISGSDGSSVLRVDGGGRVGIQTEEESVLQLGRPVQGDQTQNGLMRIGDVQPLPLPRVQDRRYNLLTGLPGAAHSVPTGLPVTNPSEAIPIHTTPEGTIIGRAPVSRFLTVTGPSGNRVMIPLRILSHDIIDDADGGGATISYPRYFPRMGFRIFTE